MMFGISVRHILWDILLFCSCICNLSYFFVPSIYDGLNVPSLALYSIAIVSLVFGAFRISEYITYIRSGGKDILRAGR